MKMIAPFRSPKIARYSVVVLFLVLLDEFIPAGAQDTNWTQRNWRGSLSTVEEFKKPVAESEDASTGVFKQEGFAICENGRSLWALPVMPTRASRKLSDTMVLQFILFLMEPPDLGFLSGECDGI